MRSLVRLLVAFLLLLTYGTRLRAQAADVPSAAEAAYKQGLDFEHRQQYDSALDSFRAAQKHCGGAVVCSEAIERVQMEMERYKDAAATANSMATAAADPQVKARADKLEGEAFYREYFAYMRGEGAYEKNPKRATDALKQAEAALARGVAADAAAEPVRMLHARVLAALKRDEDASREFTACAAVPGASPAECARALRLAHNVSAARDEPAPSFQAITMEGKPVSLDDLAGKVVLVDFWATWCTYCRRDSDYVQSLLDSFPDADRFVLLEVDVDVDRAAWTSYVSDHRLHGVQVHDEGKQMQSAFHVSGFPSYIILDGDGSIRLRATGIDGDLRGTVRKLLAEQDAETPALNGREKLPKSSGQ